MVQTSLTSPKILEANSTSPAINLLPHLTLGQMAGGQMNRMRLKGHGNFAANVARHRTGVLSKNFGSSPLGAYIGKREFAKRFDKFHVS